MLPQVWLDVYVVMLSHALPVKGMKIDLDDKTEMAYVLVDELQEKSARPQNNAERHSI